MATKDTRKDRSIEELKEIAPIGTVVERYGRDDNGYVEGTLGVVCGYAPPSLKVVIPGNVTTIDRTVVSVIDEFKATGRDIYESVKLFDLNKDGGKMLPMRAWYVENMVRPDLADDTDIPEESPKMDEAPGPGRDDCDVDQEVSPAEEFLSKALPGIKIVAGGDKFDKVVSARNAYLDALMNYMKSV